MANYCEINKIDINSFANYNEIIEWDGGLLESKEAFISVISEWGVTEKKDQDSFWRKWIGTDDESTIDVTTLEIDKKGFEKIKSIFQDFIDEKIKEEKIDSPKSDIDEQITEMERNRTLYQRRSRMFVTSPSRLAWIKSTFRHNIFKNCIYDYGTRDTKDINKVSEHITAYKKHLFDTINRALGNVVTWDDVDATNLTLCINDIIKQADAFFSSIHSRNENSSALNAYFQLVNFNEMLQDLDFVKIDEKLKPYEHTTNMYSFTGGKTKVRTQVMGKTDVAVNIDSISSNFIKEFMNYLPILSFVTKPQRGQDAFSIPEGYIATIGYQGFHRATGVLMQWLNDCDTKDDHILKIREDVTNGDRQAISEAINEYLIDETLDNEEKYKRETNAHILKSLQFHLCDLDNSHIPVEISNLYIQEMIKTTKHAFLGYDYDSHEKRISHNLFEDRQVLSEASALSNIVSGFVSQLLETGHIVSNMEFFEYEETAIETRSGNILNGYNIRYADGNYYFTLKVIPVENKQDKSIAAYRFVIEPGATNFETKNTLDFLYQMFGHTFGLPTDESGILAIDELLSTFIENENDPAPTLIELLAPIVGISIIAGDQMQHANLDKIQGVVNPLTKDILKIRWDGTFPSLNKYFKDYDRLAQLMYWISGYDNVNVIKDVSGNSVPLYGLPSVIYQFKSLLYAARQANDSAIIKAAEAPLGGINYIGNPLVRGLIDVRSPLIRNGVSTTAGIKASSDLSTPELFVMSAFIDYGQTILPPGKKGTNYATRRANRIFDGRTILVQPTVFSDKSQQFVIPFTFNDNGLLNHLKTLANNTADRELSEKSLEQYIRCWQHAKYKAILQKTINKWNKAYKQHFDLTTLDDLEDFINTTMNNNSRMDVIKAFQAVGENLVEEVDYTKRGKKYGLNLAIRHKFEVTFANDVNTSAYIEQQKRQMIIDIASNNITLYQDVLKVEGMPEEWMDGQKIILYKIYDANKKVDGKNVLIDLNDYNGGFFDENELIKNGSNNTDFIIELNPLLNSYIYADGICSQAYEEILFGANETNPSKSKSGIGEDDSASRLAMMYKRTVPAGSTVHTLLQGLTDGVSKKMRLAVVEDASFVYATNALGATMEDEPHNGAAWSSPLWSRLMNRSLGSAAIGNERAKTIFHDTDEDLNGYLCKWATYTITNDMRRVSSVNSTISAETMFKKMHDVKLTDVEKNVIWQDLVTYVNAKNLYINDPTSNYIYRITGIQLLNNKTIRVQYDLVDRQTLRTITDNNVTRREHKDFDYTNLTLYDLDQILGGAFCSEIVDGDLIASEANNDLVYALMRNMVETYEANFMDNDIRTRMIAYVVNLSAIKRGATNLNSSEVLSDPEIPYYTITMSTKYGGLMMDTEHDVDHTVKEMSQMMSSLTQNGYSIKQAMKIYSDIGAIVKITAQQLFKSIPEEIDNINIDNKEERLAYSNKVMAELEEIVVRAMMSSNNSGIGNSDSIIANINTPGHLTVPFSLSDVRNKFVSAVAAHITNDSVIRRYAGTQSVNAPSLGMIQYYNWTANGITTRHSYEKICEYLRKELKERPELIDELVPNSNNYTEDQRIKQAVLNLFKRPTHEQLKKIVARYENDNSDLDKFLRITHQKELRTGQTVYLVNKVNSDDISEPYVLHSAAQLDEVRNLINSNDYYFIVQTLAPEDLKQPQLQFTVTPNMGSSTSMICTDWDLDVTRAMYYIREFNIIEKKFGFKFNFNWVFDPNFIGSTNYELCKKYIKYFDQKFDLVKEQMTKIFNENVNKIEASTSNDNKPIFTEDDVNNVDIKTYLRILRKKKQYILNELGDPDRSSDGKLQFETQRAFYQSVPCERGYSVQNVKVTPGQIALSKAEAAKLLLKEGDDVGDILRQGSSFFKNRLSNYFVNPAVSEKSYDIAVRNKNGKLTLIKISSSEIFEGFEKDDVGLEKGARVMYYNDCEFGTIQQHENGDIQVGTFKESDKSPAYEMVLLKDASLINVLQNSGVYDWTNIFYNFTDDNTTALWSYLEPLNRKAHNGSIRLFNGAGNTFTVKEGRIPDTKTLQKHEEKRRELNIEKRAEKLYKSFEETLKYLGTRIPSQALQSCMALEVVMFVGKSNQVYIPGAMTWFEGADYDIDKTYMMRLGLDGESVNVMSDLSEVTKNGSPEKKWTLQQLANLPFPNVKLGEVDKIEIISPLSPNVPNDITSRRVAIVGNTIYVSAKSLTNDISELYALQKTLEYMNEFDLTKINVVNDLDGVGATANDLSNRFKKYINLHNNTSLRNKRSLRLALQNRNVINAYAIYQDPRHFIVEGEPVDDGLDLLKGFASKSTLGGREKRLSIWNAMTKWIMQAQFMIGKKEIGTVATAIKVYLAKNTVANQAVAEAAEQLKAGNVNVALSLLHKYSFLMQFGPNANDTVLCLLANVNLDPLREALKDATIDNMIDETKYPKFANFINNGSIDWNNLLDELSRSNAKDDVLMALSALLSACTDNAKELILSKINASQSLIDLFCAMLSSGYSLAEILDVFSSPKFSLIDTFMQTDLFSNARNTVQLEGVINFVLGEGSLLNTKNQHLLTAFLLNKDVLFTDAAYTKFRFNKDAQAYYEENIKDKAVNDKPDILNTFVNKILNNRENLNTLLKYIDELYKTKSNTSNNKTDDDDNDDSDGADNDSDNDDSRDDDQNDDPDYDNFDDDYRPRKPIQSYTIDDFDLDDLNTFRRYFSDVLFRNKQLARMNSTMRADQIIKENNNLRLVRDVIKNVSEENKILGKILKVNQGLTSELYDSYNLFKSINNFVNAKFAGLSKQNGIRVPTFDILQFLKDSTYNRECTKYYDLCPDSQINILRVINELPNFREMFSMYVTLDDIENKYQFEAYYTKRLADSLCRKIYGEYRAANKKLNEKQFKAVQSVVRSAIPYTFLQTLDIEFNIKRGELHYPVFDSASAARESALSGLQTSSENTSVNINTAVGQANFKRWVENEVYWKLKKDENFKNNEFCKSLWILSKPKNDKTKSIRCMTTQLDMNNINKSTILRTQFDAVLRDFNAIADEKISVHGVEMTIGDIMALYNIITYQDGLGKHSLKPLFKDLRQREYTNIHEAPIVLQYESYVRTLDNHVTRESLLSQFEDIENDLLNDCYWRLASDKDTRRTINEQSMSNDKIIDTCIRAGKQVGWTINGLDVIWEPMGIRDFIWDLPFLTNTRGSVTLIGSDSKIMTKHLLPNEMIQRRIWTEVFDKLNVKLKQKDLFTLITKEQIESLNLATPAEIAEAKRSVIFMAPQSIDDSGEIIYKYYVVKDNITAYTGIRALLKAADAVAMWYYDENTKTYPYRESWKKWKERMKDTTAYKDRLKYILNDIVSQKPSSKTLTDKDVQRATIEYYKQYVGEPIGPNQGRMWMRYERSIVDQALIDVLVEKLDSTAPFKTIMEGGYTDDQFNEEWSRKMEFLFNIKPSPDFNESSTVEDLLSILSSMIAVGANQNELNRTIVKKTAYMNDIILKMMSDTTFENGKRHTVLVYKGDC